ncbi:MAG: hypothetical protein AAF465_02195 [Pseudomonadota bacterium]
MKLSEAKEIIDCLPRGKTPFYYFKDRYALMLLSLVADQHQTKNDLKASRFAKLLNKGVIKTALFSCRGRSLDPNAFDAVWPVQPQIYHLTLGLWGSRRKNRWRQTSRTGFNLVLQLNFSNQHNDAYKRLVDDAEAGPFEYGGHPIAEHPFYTLAWARLDIDLTEGEALIEEIQNDWLREAQWHRNYAKRTLNHTVNPASARRKRDLIRYVDTVLPAHQGVWHEAMLAAAIWFLRRELGVNTIYYHTHDSGAKLKGIHYRQPPKSLYSRLPTQFCFERTQERPQLLENSTRSPARRKHIENAFFFKMSL